MSIKDLRIEKEIGSPKYGFPVSTKEIRRALRPVESDLEGLIGIEITIPRRNVEFGFHGRYDSRKGLVFLFAHLKEGNLYLLGPQCEIELSSANFKRKILDDTLYHEIGHHVGWMKYGLKHGVISEEFANNYAQRIRKKTRGN